METGERISYEALAKGTPVYSKEGEQIGKVAHVLAVPEEDVFDGIVIAEHLGMGGHRFVDADDVDDIREHGVMLKLDLRACHDLPEPTPSPGVMHVNVDNAGRHRGDKLRRAWDLLSGNY